MLGDPTRTEATCHGRERDGGADAAGSPVLSIIIVSWKVPDLLCACLRSLMAEMEATRGQFEVFVVDNASDDTTVDRVRREFPEVRCIANRSNVGFGAANCQAYDLCRGRLVLLLNPDTVVLPGSIGHMLTVIDADPLIGALGCRLLNTNGSIQRWTGGRFPTLWRAINHYLFLDRLLRPLGLGQSIYMSSEPCCAIDVDWVCGACLLLRPDAAPQPLFDPRYFMYGEDMDLCHRIKSRGFRVVYTPHAAIIHHQGASMKQQKGDVLLSSLKGIRTFFALTQGNRKARLLDIVTIAGFGLRYVMYRASELATRRPALALKAASSKEMLRIAVQLMKQANATYPQHV